MKKTILPLLIISTSLFSLNAQDVAFKQRLSSDKTTVRGNITVISNNILNREDTNFTSNDAYSGDGANGQLNMQYIDVDNDDTTFSSSSATLNLPSCSKVVYAGLYWSAIYPYETWEGEESRSGNYSNIKFKLPGQDYVNISSDEIIYDNGITTQKPYVCYKDMTSELTSLSDPNGDYYAANIRATVGQDSNNGLGGTAGWVLVLVYENSNETEKHISLFDGFSTIDGASDGNVVFSGVNAIPTGKVKVKALVAALDGDQSISGDSFQIKNTNGVYLNISNAINAENNLFNGTISQFNDHVTTRVPASTNTLGFDVDLFEVFNTDNSIVSNDQNTIEVRFTTGGDVYWPFLSAITVEQAEATPLNVNNINVVSSGNVASGKIEIDATGGFTGYQYSINGTEYKDSDSFRDLSEGTYSITVKDANGCVSESVDVVIDKIDIDNSVSQISETLEASFKTANSYQWIDVDTNERITGATQVTFAPTKSGNYQVEMEITQTATKVVGKTTVNKSNTQIVLSPVVAFNSGVLSVNDLEGKIIKAHPNPASDKLILSSELIGKQFKIYSILGKEVQSDKFFSDEIYINKLAKGVYILKVEGYQAIKFLKK
ncbi:T9SS type A sorting domain-containing protein [Tenacibaculum sp. MEBiC06402]|uniref:T9SS type A sorting domain-containing protein n=1 Tax=unclassified Tenacibaculum TaxID=2635139 RepID=UPI003B990703